MGRFPKRWPSRIRHCDFAIRLGEEIAFLVEAKSAAIKSLNSRHIEQASNYAANKGVNWVLLTNGVEWHLYHLTFSANGIVPDLVFELDFLEKLETEPDFAWDTLSVLAKRNVQENALDTYYERQKLLSPKTIVNTLVGEEVLMKIRQELNRKAPARLDVKDVFHAVMQVLNPEAVAAAGDITPPVKRRRRHRRRSDESEKPEVQTPTAPAKTEAQTAAEEEIPS